MIYNKNINHLLPDPSLLPFGELLFSEVWTIQ